MLHTCLGEDLGSAERARTRARSTYAPAAVDDAYRRYLTSDGLLGAVSDVLPVVERAREAGVDEIACLVDFGLPVDAALSGLPRIGELRDVVADREGQRSADASGRQPSSGRSMSASSKKPRDRSRKVRGVRSGL
ncbi:hypothetical protein [Streptomyces sp. NPDC093089]|uniref:hypothetical protein n=1 Tax=Streptomyces sp. NPDC093089 TaxID=3366024 RepID=UPI0038024318